MGEKGATKRVEGKKKHRGSAVLAAAAGHEPLARHEVARGAHGPQERGRSSVGQTDPEQTRSDHLVLKKKWDWHENLTVPPPPSWATLRHREGDQMGVPKGSVPPLDQEMGDQISSSDHSARKQYIGKRRYKIPPPLCKHPFYD